MIPFLNFEEDFLTTEDILFLAGASGVKGVEDTVTGNPVTFETDLAKPLVSLIANFLPIQASGTPAPDNILPITGWTGVNVWHGGANLLGCVIGATKSNNGIDYEILSDGGQKCHGTATASSYGIQPDGIKLPKGTYTLSVTGAVNAKTVIVKNNAYFKEISGSNYNTFTLTEEAIIYWYITFTNGTVADETVYVQLEAGQTATAYEAPVTPSEYSASFAPTIYGGYVDMVSGELTNNRYPINITPQEVPTIIIDSATQSIVTIYIEYEGNRIPPIVANSVISNRFSRNISSGNAGRMVQANRGFYLVLPASEMSGTDIEAVREWFENNPTILVCELASPVLITTLTPQQIRSMIGNNTIWSDANDDIEVTYYKKQS